MYQVEYGIDGREKQKCYRVKVLKNWRTETGDG